MFDIKIIGDPINVLRIETRLYSFDRAFVNANGDIGLPITSVELYGPTHCGKTTMAVSLSGIIATKLKTDIAMADMEGIDPNFLVTNLGNQGYSGKVYDARKETDEETLDQFIEYLKKKDIGCGIFDSVAAISPIAELEGEHGEANMGKRAKLMAQHSRKLVHVLREQHKLVFYINHELTNIGGMAYRYTPGGDELKYLARLRISVKRKEEFPDGSYTIQGTVKKNGYGLRDRVFFIFVLSGIGIHQGMSAIYDCIQTKILAKGKNDRVYAWKETGEKISALSIYAKAAKEGNTELFIPFYEALKDVTIEPTEEESKEVEE